MKTRVQILEAIQSGKQSECLDGRDFGRLTEFFPASDWEAFGFGLKEGAVQPEPKDLTEENVLAQLATDVAFGFEKALDQRGISASFMNEVVKMWMWVLDDPLQHHNDYAQYGLPLLKAVALKYNLSNPIGDDRGDEYKYASD